MQTFPTGYVRFSKRGENYAIRTQQDRNSSKRDVNERNEQNYTQKESQSQRIDSQLSEKREKRKKKKRRQCTR